MRVAVVGCGAIADSFHLPALVSGSTGATSIVLVDSDAKRAEKLAQKHGLSETAPSHLDLRGRVDAAIVCTPHHTHVPIAVDLLESGIAVLCEKPLGTSVEEVLEVAAVAERAGLPVGVNQTRRFIPACREIARMIARGELGSIERVDAREGDRFDWPAATPSMFGAQSNGRGVVLDIGVHVLDLACWWFGDGLRLESYEDDSFGGSEASAAIGLAAADTRIAIRLSWLAKQRNTYRIQGTEGTVEWGVYDLNALVLWRRGRKRPERIRIRGGPAAFSGLAPLVLADFFRAVAERRAPAVTPESVLPSIRLIEECYARRARFEMPWHEFSGSDARA
jgi:predicted dehydrogenase